MTGCWTVGRKGGPVFFDVEVTPNPATSTDPQVIHAWPAPLIPRPGKGLQARGPQPLLLIDLISTHAHSSTSHPYDQ